MAAPHPKANPVEHAALLRAVCDKDRQAFQRLFEHFAPRIKAMMMKGGLAPGPAEDVAQDTMLAVWRKAGLYDPAVGSVSAWIFTIARNRQIDIARSQRRMIVDRNQSEVEQVDGEALPDEALLAAEAETRVREALGELNAEQRQVIALAFFDNQTHSEIADALNLPLGTVKSRIRLAFQRLRSLLGDFQ